jgi:hypothetical protein
MPDVASSTSRLEGTQPLSTVGDSDTPPAREPLEPKPATQPMMMAAGSPRRWVVPLAGLLALLVVGGVAFVVLNRPTEPAVVAPPPPVTSKGPPRVVAPDKPEAPPVPVKADAPAPKTEAPVGVAKSDSPRPPRPTPAPKTPRAHTQKEATRRIDDLTTKATAMPDGPIRRMALTALEQVRRDVAAGGSVEDAWNTLDTQVMPMLK